MPASRWRPAKCEALAASLATGDPGQQAVAADLLARLTEDAEGVRLLCCHPRGEALLRTCLELAARPSAACDVRADTLEALKNAMAVEEGRALICKESLLRPILETPPLTQKGSPSGIGGIGGEEHADTAAEVGAAATQVVGHAAEVQGDSCATSLLAQDAHGQMAGCCSVAAASSESVDEALVTQAWLSLVLTVVVFTDGQILDACDLAALQDAVFELTDRGDNACVFVDCLSLLRHIYERRVHVCIPGTEECRRLARVVRAGLELAAPIIDGDWNSHSQADDDAIGHALCLVALVGSSPQFRAPLLEVEVEELDSEHVSVMDGARINVTLSRLFSGLQRVGSSSPSAWKAMSAVAEVKFVRRQMRVHPEVEGLFTCLLHSLGTKDFCLAEPIVAFLKQIFTGATDQFSSTDRVMFDNLGGTQGLRQLLASLLASARDNSSTPHRSNIVAFLADAMFFSSFTDEWQVHSQAKELIDLLFDALLWKGVEGTAGLALGNFVSANGHIDLILDHEHSACSIENVGWYMKRAAPGWDTKMQIYYLWRVLRSCKGCRLLCSNPHAADLVVAGLLKGIRHATVEDNEVLSLLECFLSDEETRPFMLRGPNPSLLLDGVCELLSNGEIDLSEPSCILLQALMDATAPTILLAYRGAARLLSVLSSKPQGKEIVDFLVPLLQWEPVLAQSLSLEYKRHWISRQVRGKAPADPFALTVSRRDVLDGLSKALSDSSRLHLGVEVKFEGDGETGSGDGHRREFFRLSTAALMDPKFGLFHSQDGGRTVHPSVTAKDAQPECIACFELCGKLIALALIHRETLPAARFTLAMRKMILGVGPLSVEDMASVDPEYYHHKIKYILEAKYAEGSSPMSIEDLDLTFEDAPQPDVFPDLRIELCPKGSQIRVTEENKGHYTDLLVDSRVRESVWPLVGALVQGLRSVVQDEVWHQMQRIVSPEELDLLICGLQGIDLADWQANSVRAEDLDGETWDLFWKVVAGLSLKQQKELLEFVTGSSGPPVGGFEALPGYGSRVHKFTVANSRRGSMPAAQTCFNTLYLPKYTDEADMSAALLEAIAHRDAGGFHEGATAPNMDELFF